MKNKRRKSAQFILGEVASGSFLKQLLLVTVILIVAFLIALVIKQFSLHHLLTLRDVKETLVEMLDGQPVIEHVYGTNNRESGGWVLLVTYFIGMIFLSGLLIAAITNMIAGYGDKFKSGDIVYHRLKDHVVFLGYDDMVIGMLSRMWQRGTFDRCDVVIALQENVSLFRTQTVSKFPSEFRDKLILMQANFNDESDIQRKLKIHKAKKVYIIGDATSESHDSMNINSFLKICRVGEAKGSVPQCYVNFKHQSSFALFQVFAGASSCNDAENATDIGLFDRNKQHFQPFNFEEVWVRKVLTNLDGEYDGFEIDTRVKDGNRRCISDVDGGYVHVVVFGMSEMGEAFTKEISFVAHYQNYIKDPRARTRITVVDDHIVEKMDYFTGRYAELFKHCHHSLTQYGETVRRTDFPVEVSRDFLDVEYAFIEANCADRRLRKELEEWCLDPKQYLTLVFCYTDPEQNNAAGLYMPRSVYESNTPIFLMQHNRGSIDKFLAKSMYSKVVPFGMCDDNIDVDESVEIEWAKRLNHFYWSGFKPDYSAEKQIETEWNTTQVADRWSSIYNVSSIPIKYRSVGHPFVYGRPVPLLTDAQLEVLARVEHNRWCVEKLMMGYKAATDDERKFVEDALSHGDKSPKQTLKGRFVHPDIVPFDMLGCDHKGIPIGDYDRMLCAEYASIVNFDLNAKNNKTTD